MKGKRLTQTVEEWSLDPIVQFKLPKLRLASFLLEHLNTLDTDHPIVKWLSVFQRKGDRAIKPTEDRQARAFEACFANFGVRPYFPLNSRRRPTELRLGCIDAKQLQDYRLLTALVALQCAGRIWSIRKCPICDQWMQARQEDQRFCATKCRQKAFQLLPEVRAKRNADRMKRYYAEKAREDRELFGDYY